MIFTDRHGNQTEIKLNEVFKKRVKLFVQKVYNLPQCPTNATLKTMFPKWSNLTKSISWVGIYAATEDHLEEQERPAMTMKEAFEHAETVLLKRNIYRSKLDTFMGRCIHLASDGATLGRIGYSKMAQSFYVAFGRYGVQQKVASLEIAVSVFIERTASIVA